jgi:hypothetical protein
MTQMNADKQRANRATARARGPLIIIGAKAPKLAALICVHLRRKKPCGVPRLTALTI